MDNETLVNALFFIFAALGVLYVFGWRLVLVFVFVTAVILLSHPAKSDTRFEVSAVIESEADRATMLDAVRDAQAIFKGQLGIDLNVTYVDIGTVAAHTNGDALLRSLVDYRLASNLHKSADATVLFTRRELIRLAGIATVTPACSASASAVVAIRNDGYDGAILAHELLHTIGVPHDHAPGYLMSETLARPLSTTVSPDAVLTVRAAGLDACMAVTPPPTAVLSSEPAAPSNAGGGGGCMEAWFLVALLALMVCSGRRKLKESRAASRYWASSYLNLKHLGKSREA